MDVNEKATCLYSTEAYKDPSTAMNVDDLEGKKFSISVVDKPRYYIQCTDVFGNKMPVTSVVVLDQPER
jgi:hypothetical protein